MGLDVVEVVMRCEKTFGVQLEDYMLQSMRTVGDLFELICEKLGLPPGENEPRPMEKVFIRPQHEERDSWTRDGVWTKLVEEVTDQLQVDAKGVKYSASFGEDLGAD